MSEDLPINPYDPPKSESRSTTAKVVLTVDEKYNAIKSVRLRIRNGESRTAIYEDWKHTDAEQTVRNVLLYTPDSTRRRKFRWANLVLLLLFLTHCISGLMLTFDFFQIVSLFLFIYIFLMAGLAYLIFISVRFGYTSANCLVAMFFVWRFWALLNYGGSIAVKATFIVCSVSGILSIVMSTYLMTRIFPHYPLFFECRRNAAGEPVFED